MKRNEIQNELKNLGCKELCEDNKTLVVYNEIQNWLYANRTPIKAITKIWVEDNEIYICVYEDNLFNTGFIIE
jgi:hypothetical protein